MYLTGLTKLEHICHGWERFNKRHGIQNCVTHDRTVFKWCKMFRLGMCSVQILRSHFRRTNSHTIASSNPYHSTASSNTIPNRCYNRNHISHSCKPFILPPHGHPQVFQSIITNLINTECVLYQQLPVSQRLTFGLLAIKSGLAICRIAVTAAFTFFDWFVRCLIWFV